MRSLYLLLLFPVFAAAHPVPGDTLFLRRELKDTPYPFYNAVYVESNYDFAHAGSITDFSFHQFDSATYYGELERLPKLKKGHRLPKNFPSEWILLYKYGNEYYTYDPSEAGEEFKFAITDSTTIDYTMEGPEPSRINSIRILSPTSIFISRDNSWKDKNVKINIIDPRREIAVFTFGPTENIPTGTKLLMVSARRAKLFRTIVNYCETDKVMEFEFDKVDFQLLERNRTR